MAYSRACLLLVLVTLGLQVFSCSIHRNGIFMLVIWTAFCFLLSLGRRPLLPSSRRHYLVLYCVKIL